MKKKVNNWTRLLSLCLALCMVVSLNLPVLANATEADDPDASIPTGSENSGELESDAPPVLTHTPITSVAPGEDVAFVATATDEMGIAYVQLFYRAVGSATWTSREMLPDEGDSFTFSISAEEISASGMEYYIEVSDGINEPVRAGSEAEPYSFVVASVTNITIESVSVTKVDISEVSSGKTAFLSGSNFVEGMVLTVGNKIVEYTLIAESFLMFTIPVNGVGKVDITLSYEGASVTLKDAITYQDGSSMLMLSFTASADSGTQIRIPVTATASNELYNMLFALKLDPAYFTDISFVMDDANSFAETSCTVTADGIVNISVNAAAPLSTGQPIGYLLTTVKTLSGNASASIRVTSAAFNGTNAGILVGCDVSILDKTPPVITVAPYETAPTNKPITIQATVDEGTLNISTYTFTENGSITLIAIDEAGNQSEMVITVNNIYKSFTLELTIPEDVVIVKGMELDTSAWQLKVIYDCGVEPAVLPVTKDMVITTTNNVGTSQGLVVYEGRATTFTYEILSDADAVLSVTRLPDKVQYLPGEALDLTGLEVTLSCGEKFTLLLQDSDYTVTGYNAETYGTQLLVVTYGSFTTSFPISVKSPVPDSITSDVYTIADGFLSGITLGTTLDVLLENIPEHEFLRVMDGEAEVSIDELLTTGMVLQLIDGETVKQSVTIVVRGDVNGDGLINITDMLSVKSHILGKSTLTGAEALAADISGDGNINITDVLQVKAHILGKNTEASE